MASRASQSTFGKVESLEHRFAMDCSTGDWHNLITPTDTTCDGTTSPLDALVVINALTFGQAGDLSPQRFGNPNQIDVNDDGVLSPTDALLIINVLTESPHADVQEQLDAAITKWDSLGLRPYEMDYSTPCICGTPNGRVSVVDRQVFEVAGKPGTNLDRYLTVEKVFETIQLAIDRPALSIRVTFDAETGHVADLHINYSFSFADAFFAFVVSDFQFRNS